MDLVIVPIVVINIVAAAVMAAIAVASRNKADARPDTTVSIDGLPSTPYIIAKAPRRLTVAKTAKHPAWRPGPSVKFGSTGTVGAKTSFAFPDTRLEVRSIVDITGADASAIPVVPMKMDGSMIGLVDLTLFTDIGNAPRIELGCRSLLGRMGKHAEPSSKMLVVAVDTLTSLLPAALPPNIWTREAQSVSVVVALNDAWSTGPAADMTFVIMLMSPQESARSVRSALAPWLGASRRMTAGQVTEKMQQLTSLLAVAGPTRVMNAGAELSDRFVVALVAHTIVQTLGSAQAIMADLKGPAAALCARFAELPQLSRPAVLIAVAAASSVASDSATDTPVSVNWLFDPSAADDKVRVWTQYPESTSIADASSSDAPPTEPVATLPEPDEEPETGDAVAVAVSTMELAGASRFLDPVWDQSSPVGNVVSQADLRCVVMGLLPPCNKT